MRPSWLLLATLLAVGATFLIAGITAILASAFTLDSLRSQINGLQDLDDRVLRHVSPAFSEDPVRILRVARFAAPDRRRAWDAAARQRVGRRR